MLHFAHSYTACFPMYIETVVGVMRPRCRVIYHLNLLRRLSEPYIPYMGWTCGIWVVRGLSADDGIIGDIASWHSLAPVFKMYLDRSDRCYESNACDFVW